MSIPLAAFNALSRDEAARALRDCCGAARWVEGMLARRPFRTVDDLLGAAAEEWRGTAAADWEEAFAHHPRIGESRADAPVSAAARTWSAGEQHGVASADPVTRAELDRANREYERRFGRIFIVCATGMTPDQMLGNLRSRLSHSPAQELRVAAAEQGKITVLRLRKMISDEGAKHR